MQFARAFSLLLGKLGFSVMPESPAADVKQTIVIVHGAWGGSWAFRRVDQMLRAKGFDVCRPSLTGLGERVHLASLDVGLGTHVEDIVNAIVCEDLRDIVLVGHSYGGAVISGVADRVPERIRKMVYLDAFVPDDGECVIDMLGPRAQWALDMVKDGFMVPPDIDGRPWPCDVPQALKTFTEPLPLRGTAKAIPVTYILMVEAGMAPEDADFARGAERARQRGWRVVHMEGNHNPQNSAPQALADLLGEEAVRSSER